MKTLRLSGRIVCDMVELAMEFSLRMRVHFGGSSNEIWTKRVIMQNVLGVLHLYLDGKITLNDLESSIRKLLQKDPVGSSHRQTRMRKFILDLRNAGRTTHDPELREMAERAVKRLEDQLAREQHLN